ncbi:hypothetical protein ACQY0O_004064 [Thecaphora frezii]
MSLLSRNNQQDDDAYLLHLRQRCIASRRRNAIPFDDSPTFPPRLPLPPSSGGFQNLIDRHVPVIIHGCLSDRPCLWNEWQRTEYLVERMGESPVVVALTPDGRADDLVAHPDPSVRASHPAARVFALPYDTTINLHQLVTQLKHQSRQPPAQDCGCVAYLQSQNSNLDTSGPLSGDLAPLWQDVCTRKDGSARGDIEWATEAMGKPPEATNIWIGTGRSRTSMHRDHYENLFTVVRGCKVFTVYPPNEGHFLCDDEEYPVYRYRPKDCMEPGSDVLPSCLTLEADRDTPPTRWIPIDPTLPKTDPRNRRYVHRDLNRDASQTAQAVPCDGDGDKVDKERKRYGYALPPLTIRVQQGETLYLPSGWYHHVAQQEDHEEGRNPQTTAATGVCLCLNWWYEMSDEMVLRLAEMDEGSADLDPL